MNSINALAKGVSAYKECNDVNIDRRREPRALTAAIAQLVQDDICECECVLENLSLTGACVYLKVRLETGTQASLIVANIRREVIIKYSNPCANGFNVGLEFADEPWPERVTGPVHWIRDAR